MNRLGFSPEQLKEVYYDIKNYLKMCVSQICITLPPSIYPWWGQLSLRFNI